MMIRELFCDIIDACATIDDIRDDAKHNALTIDDRSKRIFKCIEQIALTMSIHDDDNDDACAFYRTCDIINERANKQT